MYTKEKIMILNRKLISGVIKNFVVRIFQITGTTHTTVKIIFIDKTIRYTIHA